MKRLTLVFAVALGLAVAALVGLWSSNSASARIDQGLKCYRVQNVETLETGHGPLVYIRDQFEEENLIIKKPISFCGLANKSGTGTGTTAGEPPSPQNLVCYAIKDAPGQLRFQPVRVRTQDQFDENDLQVTKPYGLCTPAEKAPAEQGASSGFTDGEPLNDYEFKCYTVRRLENGERFRKFSQTLFDQFDEGGKDVRLGRPSVFCTQVFSKKPKAKNDHIDHALSLDPPQDVHVSTIGAGRDRSDPEISCVQPSGINYGHTVWYTYTPGITQRIQVDTEQSTYDTVVAIFRGDPANGDEVACDDDSGSGESSLIFTKFQGGEKYFIMVAAYAGTPGGKLKFHMLVTGGCASCGAGSTAATTVLDQDAEGDTGGDLLSLNLVCYSLSQRAPEDIRLRTSDQFTLSEFDVGRGIMYCTPASKCILVSPHDLAPDAAIAGEPGPTIILCADEPP